MWSANTLTFSAEKKESRAILSQLSRFDPDHYPPPESHVHSRASAVVLFKFCLGGDCLVFLPGGGGEGKRVFFFSLSLSLRQTSGHEGEGRKRREADREMARFISKKKPACTLPGGMLLEGFVGGKTPGGADLRGGLSRGSSRPDAGSIRVFV